MIIKCINCSTQNNIGDGENRKAICARCGMNLIEKRLNSIQPISLGASQKIEAVVVQRDSEASFELALEKTLKQLQREIIDIKYSISTLYSDNIMFSALILYRNEK